MKETPMRRPHLSHLAGLDLYYLSSQVSQDAGGHRSGQGLGQVQDADTFQWCGHGPILYKPHLRHKSRAGNLGLVLPPPAGYFR